MNLKLRILVIMMVTVRISSAQTSVQVITYINTYKSLAIVEMQRSGVPASITLAQGIHETQAGMSDLVIASNNHFGIKCKTGWTGPVVRHDDDARGECFRSYAAAADSYRDHSDYLSQTPRYAFLFKLNPEDYASWAYGLKKAGYATNIRYSQILIKIIEDYNLQQYSLIALGKLPPEDLSTVNRQPSTINGQQSSVIDSLSTANSQRPTANYPEGIFSINETKVIYAKAGVSLLALSNQYDIPLARLLDFNDMNQEDILANDQLIFLQRKRRTGSSSIHIVQPGESIYMICQQEGIRYENILDLNLLKPGEEPAPGEKIYLQSVSGTKPALRNQNSAKTSIPSS